MKITVRKFQAINEVKNSPLDEIDKSLEMVRVVTGMDMEQIKKMKLAKFNKICLKVASTFNRWAFMPTRSKRFIKVNGRAYRINDNIYDMNAARYVEAITFSRDSVANMHKLLASMVVPQHWTILGLADMPYPDHRHEWLSEQMLDADYDDVYPSLVPFMASLAKISEEFGYLWEGGGESGGAMAAAFSKVWGWTYNTKMVSEMEGISLDEAWDMPVRKYLNDLSYLKMKREMDDEYLKKMELKRR